MEFNIRRALAAGLMTLVAFAVHAQVEEVEYDNFNGTSFDDSKWTGHVVAPEVADGKATWDYDTSFSTTAPITEENIEGFGASMSFSGKASSTLILSTETHVVAVFLGEWDPGDPAQIVVGVGMVETKPMQKEHAIIAAPNTFYDCEIHISGETVIMSVNGSEIYRENIGPTASTEIKSIEFELFADDGTYGEIGTFSLDRTWALMPPKPRIILDTSAVNIGEGKTEEVRVSLAEDNGEVEVMVDYELGDLDLTVSPETFVLSSSNPSQMITVSAGDDVDEVNGSRQVVFSAEDYQSAELTLYEVDDDLVRFVIQTKEEVEEGQTLEEAVSIKLNREPTAPVNVVITKIGDDDDVTTEPSSFTLDSNIETYLTVTVAEDADLDNEAVVFEVTGDSLEATTFTINVRDTSEPAPVPSSDSDDGGGCALGTVNFGTSFPLFLALAAICLIRFRREQMEV